MKADSEHAHSWGAIGVNEPRLKPHE